MTTLYRPVLIETAEQADALPVGTPVLTILTDLGEDPRVVGADCIDDSFDEDLTPGGNWHCVALVPIEAEEEWTVGHDAPAWAPGTETWAREFQAYEPGRRLFRRSTTAWEEA